MFGQWSYCWVYFVTEGTPSSLVPKGGACFVRSRRVAPMSVQVTALVMCDSVTVTVVSRRPHVLVCHLAWNLPSMVPCRQPIPLVFPPGVFVTHVYIQFAAAISSLTCSCAKGNAKAVFTHNDRISDIVIVLSSIVPRVLV